MGMTTARMRKEARSGSTRRMCRRRKGNGNGRRNSIADCTHVNGFT
jgi:hypothetical protein